MLDNNNETGHPIINTLIAMCGAIFAWVTLKDVQLIMTIIATGVSITAGCFAVIQSYRNIRKK